MKTIEQIAREAAAKIEPSHAASVALKATATHPEIIAGREAQERHHGKLVEILADAIRKGKEEEAAMSLALASAAIDMMTLHSPHTEEMMRHAIQRWKTWQLHQRPKHSRQNATVDSTTPAP